MEMFAPAPMLDRKINPLCFLNYRPTTLKKLKIVVAVALIVILIVIITVLL